MTDTNPPADRTAEIRARLDAASKSTTMDVHAGRSILRATVTGGDRGRFVGGMGDLVAATVGETGPLTVTVADDEDGQDATLVLHARDDLAYLLARVEDLERQLAKGEEEWAIRVFTRADHKHWFHQYADAETVEVDLAATLSVMANSIDPATGAPPVNHGVAVVKRTVRATDWETVKRVGGRDEH